MDKLGQGLQEKSCLLVHCRVVAGIEGDDEAVLNVLMHSRGGIRRSHILTGSTSKEPKAKDYPPEGPSWHPFLFARHQYTSILS